jgi:hypothetical protein
MNFTHYDLGQLQARKIVEVNLEAHAANVRLMDPSNFLSYRSGQRHSYIGGYATQSLVPLRIPHSGHWQVVVDLGGYEVSVLSGVKVLT